MRIVSSVLLVKIEFYLKSTVPENSEKFIVNSFCNFFELQWENFFEKKFKPQSSAPIE